MTLWTGITCDLCETKVFGIDPEVDLESWLRSYRWDSDPTIGHLCPACARLNPKTTDDQLEIESSIEQEKVQCASCRRPIFFGSHSHTRGLAPFNAEPHHCGHVVESCVISPNKTIIRMGNTYYRIGVEAPGPTYAAHVCRKSDLKKVLGEG